MEAYVGLFMPCLGEVEVHHRRFEVGVPQGALEETGGHASVEERGGGRMAKRMDGHSGVGKAGPVLGCAEGALDTGPTQRGGRRRTVVVIPSGSRKEPGLVTMGCPVGSEPSAGSFRQRDVTVLGPLAAGDLDLEALAIDVGDLQGEGFMEPESQARAGGEVDLGVPGGSRLEETPHFFNTEDGGETVGGLSPNQRQGGPIALEDVLREAADAPGADAPGSRGQAIDVLPGQEGVLKLLFRDQVRRFVVELSQPTPLTDRGFLRPFALATELESRKHWSAQWGHELSPFLS